MDGETCHYLKPRLRMSSHELTALNIRVHLAPLNQTMCSFICFDLYMETIMLKEPVILCFQILFAILVVSSGVCTIAWIDVFA